MIKLLYAKNEDTICDITKLIKSVTWSGDIRSCCRTLEFNLVYAKDTPSIDIPLSSLIMFYENGKELFRGFVFDREKSQSDMSFTCYDYAQRLNNVKASYNFTNKTPSEIFNQIASDYSISKGNIASSTAKVTKLYMGKSLYEIIMSAYTEQSKIDSKKYMIQSVKDKIEVVEKGNNSLKIAFEEAKNILDSSFKESLNSMINQVVIVDDKGNKKSTVKDDNLLKIHGLFQEVYQVEEGKDYNVESKKLLNGIDQSCSLEGFGDYTCVTGRSVYIKDSASGLIGVFWIDSDTHTFEGESHKVQLELNFKNIMDSKED